MTPSRDAVGDAELERLIIRFIVGVIAVLLAGGGLAVANRVDDADARAETDVFAAPELASGADIASYVATRRERIDGLSGPHLAIVSFASYESAAAVDDLVGVDRARRLHVAVPAGSPAAIAPAQLEAWAREALADAHEEAFEIERLLPSVSSPDFVRQYEIDLARLRVLSAELERMLAGDVHQAPVVFAIEVIAPAAELQQIAADPRVRLVDPSEGRAVPRALRPEETARVGEPPYRP